VFNAEYGVQIIIMLDDHAGAQLGGRDRHCLKLSPSKMRFAELTEGGAGHIFRRTRGPNLRFYTPLARKETFPQSNSSHELEFSCERFVPLHRWTRITTDVNRRRAIPPDGLSLIRK
jgi:hypothetical protein